MTTEGGSAAEEPVVDPKTGSLAMARHGHLIKGSVWLLATVAANALSGLLFWLVAFRLDSAGDVGRATALFTSIQFVNYASSLGLPVAIARYAPDREWTSQALFGWAVVLTTGTSLLGTIAFGLLGPDELIDVLSAWGTPAGLLLFFTLVAGMSLAILVEVRLMTLRRWGWVLGRVALVGLARFPLLFIRPIDNDALWIAVLAAGAPAASGFIGAAVLRWSARDRRLLPLPETTRAAARYAGVNYLGLLAAQGPQFALPVIVLVNVTPEQNAAFYVAWGITTIVFLIPHTIGQVLLVEGGRDGSDLGQQVRLTMAAAVGVMGLISIAGAAVPGLVETVYGESASDAVPLVPWFLLAGGARARNVEVIDRKSVV